MFYYCTYYRNSYNKFDPGYREWIEVCSEEGFVLATQTTWFRPGPLPSLPIRGVCYKGALPAFDPWAALEAFRLWLLT